VAADAVSYLGHLGVVASMKSEMNATIRRRIRRQTLSSLFCGCAMSAHAKAFVTPKGHDCAAYFWIGLYGLISPFLSLGVGNRRDGRDRRDTRDRSQSKDRQPDSSGRFERQLAIRAFGTNVPHACVRALGT
jgi:hypothetical protein